MSQNKDAQVDIDRLYVVPKLWEHQANKKNKWNYPPFPQADIKIKVCYFSFHLNLRIYKIC